MTYLPELNAASNRRIQNLDLARRSSREKLLKEFLAISANRTSKILSGVKK